MAMKIMTLCVNCAENFKIGGYKIKPYTMNHATTKKNDKCDACGKKASATLDLYIVEGRNGK